jgi:hypothetical protein
MSPHNVFVGYDGQVKVLDFGIAKVMGSEGQTQTGVLKGKLRYMSPEQAAGDTVDGRSDLFSVGIMLWEALAGRRMWQDASETHVLRSLLEQRLPELDARDAPPRLVEVCKRALAFDPEQRYLTASDLRRDLQEYLEGRSGSVDEALIEFLNEHFDDARQQTRERVAELVRNASSAPPRASPSALEVTRDTNQPRRRIVPIVALALLAAIATWLGVALLLPRATTADGSSPGAKRAVEPCASGTKSCGGQCVSVDRPEHGCSAEGCAPCLIPNATPRCSRNHQCDISVCYRGYENCDGDPSNGCEADLRTDPENCGACSQRCPDVPHAQVACGDSCRVWRCSVGHEDCNGRVEDGCETDVTTDRQSCGACGVRCGAGQVCRRSQCTR